MQALQKFIRRTKFTLPDLPYDYNALEPVISSKIMQIHHGKHHATYVNNLNNAMDALNTSQAANDLETFTYLTNQVKFNAGGHNNHAMFWKNLAPAREDNCPESKDLSKAIEKDFGSYEKLKEVMSKHATAVQGSGWAWLGVNDFGKLSVASSSNQDVPVGMKPILTIDVWEHAYYLQYANVRADFVKMIWSIINWNDVSERYNQITNPTLG
jgi:superoxide dismutase, Fe-Mn family